MKVLIPGGCGYVGAMLTPWLLARGHYVTVFDTQWFGRGAMPDNEHLRVIVGDVRDVMAFTQACDGQDAVIYLASVSNNDFCVQKPELAEAVNVRAMMHVPKIARAAGVTRFIYASSVAGYPAGEQPSKETQDVGQPTPYALGKVFGEGSTRGQEQYTIVRSASVCGPSPRMRFDLTVNKMVHDAMRYGVITVNGGEQKRSHINIRDLCDFYALLLDVGQGRIAGQTFNAVAENQSVSETAQIVSEITGARIETKPRSDNRSYTVDGSKAREVLGFTPKRTVREAVIDMKVRFDSDAKGITKQYVNSLTDKRFMNFADGIA